MAQAIYGVGQVNAYIKNIFDNDYALRSIKVRGEVSNCKYSAPGHIYFTLKDEGGAISAVMFAGKRANGLKFRLEDGQKVIVSGAITVYERDGRYQIYASGIVLDGVGDLYLRFEESKKRLAEMGMFAPEYKKPIPRFAVKGGIVTASTGAAIQDIINISSRRNPYVQLYLCPAAVQGEYAVPTIVRGIETLDKMGLDVIIVGRGGGSIEDLWAFNEEPVARAIFEADTPIISAVGHETDTTIADYVADLRAPTPSAAAELAVYDVNQYLEDLDTCADRLKSLLGGRIYEAKLKIDNYRSRIDLKSPRRNIELKKHFLESAGDRLNALLSQSRADTKHLLEVYITRLEAKSPLARLKGGFGYIETSEGKAALSINDIREQECVRVRLSDGAFSAQVLDTLKEK